MVPVWNEWEGSWKHTNPTGLEQELAEALDEQAANFVKGAGLRLREALRPVDQRARALGVASEDISTQEGIELIADRFDQAFEAERNLGIKAAAAVESGDLGKIRQTYRELTRDRWTRDAMVAVMKAAGLDVDSDGHQADTEANALRLGDLARSGELVRMEADLPEPVRNLLNAMRTHLDAEGKPLVHLSENAKEPGYRAFLTSLMNQNAAVRNDLNLGLLWTSLYPRQGGVGFTRGFWQEGTNKLWVSPDLSQAEFEDVVIH